MPHMKYRLCIACWLAPLDPSKPIYKSYNIFSGHTRLIRCLTLRSILAMLALMNMATPLKSSCYMLRRSGAGVGAGE